MELVKKLTIRVLALIVLTITFITLCIIGQLNAEAILALSDGFSRAVQSITALSVSLIIFPFITVPAVESTVTRARSVGMEVSKKLVKDYIDGCFTVFTLALAEIASMIIYSFIPDAVVLYVSVSLLVSMLAVLGILMHGLWLVLRLLYEAM